MKTTVKKKAGLAIAATAALLLTACASDDSKGMNKKGSDAMGQCHGVNSCKGTSACATAESSCAGHNSCKGKGWIPSTKANCESQGGGFQER